MVKCFLHGIKKCAWPGVFVSKMLKELSHKHLPMNQCRLPLLDVFISIIRYYKNSVNQEPGIQDGTVKRFYGASVKLNGKS